MAIESSRGPWRLEITACVAFDGPVRVASGERLSLLTDLPILRTSGRTWIPGSSIRGVLRDWCEREAPLLGVGDDVVNRLFGVTPRRGSKTATAKNDRQGRLVVRDLELGDDSRKIDFRDHVAIERKWNSAAKGGKFDEQVAAVAGGVIRLVYHGDTEQDDELRLIGAALSALKDGQLSLGGRSGSGFGWLKPADVADWLQRRIDDRKTEDGLAAFVAGRLKISAPSTVTPVGADEPLRQPYPTTVPTVELARLSKAAPWNWLTLPLTLNFDGPMVIVGQNRHADDWIRATDDAFLTDLGGKAVLPGSSLRGVLKSNADRIVTTKGLPGIKSARDALFGTTEQRGLLHVGEGGLTGLGKPIQLDHVAIDRLTGFAATNKLFQVAALQSPSFSASIRVRWQHDDPDHQRAVALLFFLIRDIASGRGWVGSRTTRGYGHLKAIKFGGLTGSLVAIEGGTGARQAFDDALWSNATTREGIKTCFAEWSKSWQPN